LTIYIDSMPPLIKKENFMNKMIALACLGLAFAVSAPVFAGAQQEKMKGCNLEAKGMKGDERKAFMSKCLKKDYVLKSDSTAAPAKPEAKPEVKPAPAKAEAKPEAKPAPAKVEAKPAAAKVEAAPAKAEAKPAPAKAETKAEAAPVKQQDKMKSCNAEAKTKALKGDDRKKFMSACLKA
jgi:outer membrane biosynthesis protein TonB